ncbi:MAG: paraquat-inducible protein A [Proteobacteria bacterium]|nr:paraquat-inducible protein A [Pseudomonadota bacterium]
MSQRPAVITCHDCGLLQKISHLPEDGTVTCSRCDATLRKIERIKPADNIEHLLALVITALVIFIIANSFPVIDLQVAGHEVETSLYGIIHYLLTRSDYFLGGLVFLTALGAPLIQLTGLLYILLPLNSNVIPPFAAQVYRVVRLITQWSMLEVLMLGLIVSLVKLSAMGTLIPSVALFAFLALIFFIADILSNINSEIIWSKISTIKQDPRLKDSERPENITNCHNCHLLCKIPEHHEGRCPRCDSPLHKRKPDSMARCTAYLIAAVVLYIPANLLPVMVVSSLGHSEGETIMGGIIYLGTSGDMSLAIIVFVASMVVPSIKLIILTLLLITTYFKSQWNMKDRTRLYRLTELIGRWSMVDIFVTASMAALIQIQGLAVIEVGGGAIAFGAVVVLTILAAMSFDPRLIWDNLEKKNE